MATIATKAVADLRAANPALYPPAPHCWYRLVADQLRVPMLCVVCQDRFQPEHDVRTTPMYSPISCLWCNG